MKIVIRVVGLVLLCVVALMVQQHFRYMDARENAVQDYQAAFHGDVFHVLTFMQATESDDFLTPLKTLVAAARDTEASLIYAGQVIHVGLESTQIAQTFGKTPPWDAILVQEFASEAAYQVYLARDEIAAAEAQFAQTYRHGYKRSATLNVLLHQYLLLQKIWRWATLAPDVLPFQPAVAADQQLPGASGALLNHASGLGRDAILIVNLAQTGTPEEQAANASYGAAMLGLMADLGYGPMHIGTAVALEHDHHFDQAMLVYYPGSKFFNDLSTSTWFQSIIGDKQLADTQAVITVPITNLLL